MFKCRSKTLALFPWVQCFSVYATATTSQYERELWRVHLNEHRELYMLSTLKRICQEELTSSMSSGWPCQQLSVLARSYVPTMPSTTQTLKILSGQIDIPYKHPWIYKSIRQREYLMFYWQMLNIDRMNEWLTLNDLHEKLPLLMANWW